MNWNLFWEVTLATKLLKGSVDSLIADKAFSFRYHSWLRFPQYLTTGYWFTRPFLYLLCFASWSTFCKTSDAFMGGDCYKRSISTILRGKGDYKLNALQWYPFKKEPRFCRGQGYWKVAYWSLRKGGDCHRRQMSVSVIKGNDFNGDGWIICLTVFCFVVVFMFF